MHFELFVNITENLSLFGGWIDISFDGFPSANRYALFTNSLPPRPIKDP